MVGPNTVWFQNLHKNSVMVQLLRVPGGGLIRVDEPISWRKEEEGRQGGKEGKRKEEKGCLQRQRLHVVI